MKPWSDITKCIHLQNRGLEPPEPMMRILTALNQLGDDEYILAYNDREPMFLYPKLQEMGYPYESQVQEDGSCLIAIRRPKKAEGSS